MNVPGIGTGLFGWTALAVNGPTFWLPQQSSSIAPKIDLLFYIIAWISAFFFVLIVAVMVLFVIKYRSRPGLPNKPSPSHNTTLEIVWSGVPMLLILVIFWYSFRAYIDLQQPPDNSYQVQVNAIKWSWTFTYPNGASSDTLYAQVGVPVKLTMTSQDVIHSLFIPDFRTKQDVVPGRYSYLWFQADQPGEHPIYCAEYCGTKHSFMWSKVIVLEKAEFDKKLAEIADIVGNSKSPEEAGEKLFKMRGCAQCHSVDGTKGTGPSMKGIFGHEAKLKGGASVMVDENYIRQSILDPGSQVVEGFEPVMPTFQGRMKDNEIDAIIQYIKTVK